MARVPTKVDHPKFAVSTQAPAYHDQVNTVDAEPTLLTATGDIRGTLSDVYQRLRAISDSLLGSQPRDAGAPGAPEPVPTVRRNLRVSNEIIGDICTLLSDLEHNV